MDRIGEMIEDLRAQWVLGRELLALVERESQGLRRADRPPLADEHAAKKALLPRLNQTLDQLRKHRVFWQKLSVSERSKYPEVGALIRQNQDQIMKIIMLDRENEQALLRRGLVPARDLPLVAPQKPHYVADMYRRRGNT